MTIFIKSDYIIKEKRVKKLFFYLVENLYSNPQRIDAFQYIYPNEEYRFNKFNYLSAGLYQALKTFIEIENLLLNPSTYNTSLLQKYKKFNKQHLYELEENIIIKNEKKSLKKSSIEYQKNYLFEYERLNYYAEQKRAETKYIKNLHYNLDAYYFIEKLKASCTSINQQKLYKIESELSFTNLLIDYIKNSDLLNKIPLLSIYYSAYKMLVNGELKYFKSLKESLEKFEIDVIEIRDAFIFGLNFCIQQINSGNNSYNNEMFEMYQTGIKKGIILNQGKLTTFDFSNIVTIGLRLKKYDEVESFIEENKRFLTGSEKDSSYAFNLAKVYFEKGKFQEVTALYNEKLIKEILLNIQMRILQIKAFYELGELDICESLILSTDQLLNRKGILAYHKKVFKNFIKFSKSLIHINSFDKKSSFLLKEKIENSNTLVDKIWLLSKL